MQLSQLDIIMVRAICRIFRDVADTPPTIKEPLSLVPGKGFALWLISDRNVYVGKKEAALLENRTVNVSNKIIIVILNSFLLKPGWSCGSVASHLRNEEGWDRKGFVLRERQLRQDHQFPEISIFYVVYLTYPPVTKIAHGLLNKRANPCGRPEPLPYVNQGSILNKERVKWRDLAEVSNPAIDLSRQDWILSHLGW